MPDAEAPPLLPPGALCPRCGYEFGVPDTAVCSECGMAVGHVVRQAIADRARLRLRLRMLNAIVLHIAAAVIFAIAVETSPAFDGGIQLEGTQRIQLVSVCVGVVATTLTLGLAASLLARRGERMLWADLWARAHLLIYAPWILIPIACSLPTQEPLWWNIGLWTSLSACVACGMLTITLRARRRLRLVLLARIPALVMNLIFILQIIAAFVMVTWMPYLAIVITAINRA